MGRGAKRTKGSLQRDRFTARLKGVCFTIVVRKRERERESDVPVLITCTFHFQGNYKKYRQSLAVATTPCVPYVGVFLKDLTFICDGNPDYLRGGLINLHKRRQVCGRSQEGSEERGDKGRGDNDGEKGERERERGRGRKEK